MIDNVCLTCGERLVGVEYAYGDPYRYDGVSEWYCPHCNIRIGRWSGLVLEEGEQEPPYGDVSRITNKTKHYNL